MILTVHERYALAMKHAKKFVGRSAARPILSGVYHSADGTLVATDAHRLLRVENAHERSEAIVLDSKTSAPIDGTYPDITHIIPKAYCAEYGFGSESLEELIKAHEIMVKVGGKKSPYASIAVTGSGLTFTTTCGIGVYEVSPTVQIESFSDEFTLHYNTQFVLDALIALRDFKPKTVGIKFTGEESPFVIDTDDGVLALILPIRRQKEAE